MRKPNAACSSAARLTRHSPSGGFFAVLDVPVCADAKLLEISARDYGVLWTPMSFFCLNGGDSHAIGLSCSALVAAQIDEGRRRLTAHLAVPAAGRHGGF